MCEERERKKTYRKEVNQMQIVNDSGWMRGL